MTATANAAPLLTRAPPRDTGPRERRPLDFAVSVLLVLAFCLGPVKLLGVWWLGYLVPDALASLIVLAVAFARSSARRPLFAQSALTAPMIFLGVWCVLALFNPEAAPLRSLLGLRSWLLYLAFYFVGLYTFRSVRQLQRLYALLLTLGCATGLYGIYQWIAGPQAFASWSDDYSRYAQLAWSATTGTVFRAFSTFVAPGTFADNMALLMMLAFGVVVSDGVPRRWRVAAAAAFATMGVAIIVSGSRGPVVRLALAGALMVLVLPGVRSKVQAVTRASVVVGLVLVVVGLQVGSVASQRFATILDPEAFFWKWFQPLVRGVEIALAHPMGMGLGYTAGVPQFVADPLFRDLPTTNVDSGYGAAAAEMGLVGLLVFVYFAVEVGLRGVRAWRKLSPGPVKDLLLGPALMAGTYPVVSVIAQPQAALPSAIYFWLLIGMLIRASTRDHADRLLRSELHAGE